MSQYSLSLPTRAGFLQLRERASAWYTIFTLKFWMKVGSLEISLLDLISWSTASVLSWWVSMISTMKTVIVSPVLRLLPHLIVFLYISIICCWVFGARLQATPSNKPHTQLISDILLTYIYITNYPTITSRRMPGKKYI